MDPLISLVVSLLALFILVFRKVDISYSLTISTFLFGVLVFNIKDLIENTCHGLFSFSTLRLFLAFILAFYFAALLRNVGVMDKIVKGMSSINKKFTAIFLPSIVGLIPMPGGALVSAVMLKDLYLNDLEIGGEKATFINFWFRHIWVTVWPLYQSLIVASILLNVKVWQVISCTYPISLATIVGGLLVVLPLLKNTGENLDEKSNRDFKAIAEGFWPFLVVIVLVLGLRLDIVYSLVIVVVLTSLVYRPNKSKIKSSLKFAFNPKILLIIAMVMIYKEYVMNSGVNLKLYSLAISLGLPIYLVLFLIPFIIGLATSGEFVFVAMSFPVLINILAPGGSIDPFSIFIAYLGGVLSVLITPIHLCLALTLKYFNAKTSITYRYILLSMIFSLILGLPLGLLFLK
ncbi:MAG: DUF401 family protein [Candidatus Odinarchaeota archaeon]|nr:DUF401 family protein [Candidatus Odinarchaeota archaeon]